MQEEQKKKTNSSVQVWGQLVFFLEIKNLNLNLKKRFFFSVKFIAHGVGNFRPKFSHVKK